MSSSSKKTAKHTILYNYVRHADTHNRMQEESEMWRLRKLERQSHMEPHRTKRRYPITRGRLLSDTMIDEDYRNGRDDVSERSSPKSFYWTRQLFKAEESDPHRWGHSGYKELYPEEFKSTDEEEGEEKASPTIVREKKRKKEKLKRLKTTTATPRKRERLKKKAKKRKKRLSVSSDDMESRTKKK